MLRPACRSLACPSSRPRTMLSGAVLGAALPALRERMTRALLTHSRRGKDRMAPGSSSTESPRDALRFHAERFALRGGRPVLA